jgi:hypothetical protein
MADNTQQMPAASLMGFKRRKRTKRDVLGVNVKDGSVAAEPVIPRPKVDMTNA